MNAVSYAEANENLETMIDKVVADRAPLAITLERGEGAVLISACEWTSIEETLSRSCLPNDAEQMIERVDGFEEEKGGVRSP